jgi:hypothetical protein
MAERREHFRTRGRLRGEGHERVCSVHGTKVNFVPDEIATSIRVIYERVEVADHDDLPDGAYELTFDGQTIPLTRKGGVYLGR